MISCVRGTVSSVPSPVKKRAHPPALTKNHLPHMSKRLHTFPLSVLKWGGTRRAARSVPCDHPNLPPRSCAVFSGQTTFNNVSRHPHFPVRETSSLAAGTIDPAVGEIKEFGQKLLDDIRSAVAMEYQIWKEAGARGSNIEKAATTHGPWKLGARRSTCQLPGECGDSTRLDAPTCPARETKISKKIRQSPSVNLPTGVVGFRPVAEAGTGVGREDKPASTARSSNLPERKTSNKSSDDSSQRDALAMITSMPAAVPTTITTANLFKSSRLRNRVAAVGERKKFALVLSKEEVEEDWVAITGSRPPRRPTKRPRHIQQQLDLCFPGSFLSEMTSETYKRFRNLGRCRRSSSKTMVVV